MKSICDDLTQHIPVRARVAFVLAIAERVAPAISGNAEAFNVAREALADGWKWEEDEGVEALQIYENDVEALAVQGSLINNGEACDAMCAVISAFFYMMWHAFRRDLIEGHVQEGDIPNDIADVAEEVIQEVCVFATRTSLCDNCWITSIAERLSRDFRTAHPEELGPVVARHYFR